MSDAVMEVRIYQKRKYGISCFLVWHHHYEDRTRNLYDESLNRGYVYR